YRQQVTSENDPNAVAAITHYTVLETFRLPSFPDLPDAPTVVTKVKLRLETGLKHQIRIQANEEGLPLLGDRLYHAAYKKKAPQLPGPLNLTHQALHAETLG